MPILKAAKLTKQFGSGSAIVTALKEVNFSVEPGESVAIIGASGWRSACFGQSAPHGQRSATQ